MTTVFNGMTSVLNQVFGADVTFVPATGPTALVRSVFRETPVEVADGDTGRTIVGVASWTVARPFADTVLTGDEIEVGDRRFSVLARYPSGSPATDAFVRFVLEEVTP